MVVDFDIYICKCNWRREEWGREDVRKGKSNGINSKAELEATREKKGMDGEGEQWDEGAACGRRLNRNKMCVKGQS